ncbi:MAG: MBL fold metallo-hydrolase [Lentisphaeraceae bacterium]|nr:MBL fold metallo-hydrolase [Lentisphaeraceae bacterium]
MAISVFTFPVGLYQCNCSIIVDDETKEALIIDPGDESETILQKVEEQGLKVKFLLHTHAHLDHFGATSKVKKQCCGAKTVLHKDDLFLYDLHKEQSAMLHLPETEIDPIDHFLEDEETFSFGKENVKGIVTPGHSPGSTCFKLETSEKQIIFSGDTLFRSSIGRTDLPGGDSGKIVNSIKSRLFSLDGDFQVIPGHGPATSIAFEKRSNPFVGA